MYNNLIKKCALYTSFLLIAGCSALNAPMLPPSDNMQTDAEQVIQRYQQNDQQAGSEPLRLERVIALAVQNNVELIKQQTELALSQNDVKNLRWANGLELTGERNADSKTNDVDEEKSIIARFDTLSVGSAYYDEKLQKADTKMREALVFQSAQLTAIEATQLYYELLAHQAMETKINAMNPDLLASKQIYTELLESRLNDTLSILGASLELGEIQASLMDTRQTAYELRDRFRKLVGQTGYASVQLNLPSSVPQTNIPDTPQLHQLTAVMLASRYDVLVTYLEEKQARDNYKKTLLSWLPSISLGYGRDSNEAEPYFDTWRISWNILNIFKLANAHDVYDLRKSLTQLSRDNAILNLHQDLTTLSEITEHNKLAFQLKAGNADLSVRSFNALSDQSEFTAGRLVLLKSKLNTIESEFKRDMAYANYMTSLARLKYAAGIPIVPRNWMELDFEALEQEVEKWKEWDWSSDL